MLVLKVKRALTAVAGLALLANAGGAAADYALNLRRGVTSISHNAYDLHMLILWICVAIGAVVFAAMFISIFSHRKSKGAKPAQFHESTTVEILWTVVPFLILIGIAVPATKALVAMEDTSNSDLSIKVTGYQWKWGYDYLKGEGEGISFLSTLTTPREQINNQAPKSTTYLIEVDNEVVVPVNRKVRIVTTANDVIHSWMIPAFGVKQDAIPGFVRDTWFKAEKVGVYRGQCAELCGKDHGFMPIVVKVVEEDEYQQWVLAKQEKAAAEAAASGKAMSKEELMARGESVYKKSCLACHQDQGQGLPPMFPALAGGKIATGPAAAHIDIVLHGKPNTAMQAFGAQLNDADLAAVITYERNSWGNSAGVVQPSDVKAAR